MTTMPANQEAELAVIGCVIANPAAYVEAADQIKPSDFYQPANEQVWSTIRDMHVKGAPLTAIGLNQYLTDSKRPQLLASVLEATTAACLPQQLSYYSGMIRDLAARRRGIDAAQSMLQRFAESTEAVETLVEEAEAALRKVPTTVDESDTEMQTLDEFCDQEMPEADWVIPGLLNRGDRLVLTGGEGLGKTVMMRQLAVCSAAGVHPFQWTSMPARTVLYIDCENPKGIMIKSFGHIRQAIRQKRGPIDPNRLWIRRRPEGLHLGNPADRLWLHRMVALANPDLLCIGPAYKLYQSTGRERDEDLARQVSSALDSVREAADCAVVLEHHSPHQETGAKNRDVRPIGSSLWLRWPEFGYGIRPADGYTKLNRLCDFRSWRGPRDERNWPEQVQVSGDFLPWMDASYA